MNIAFFVNEFPKPSETFILNQITGLLDRGHQVDIYAKWPDNQSVTHPHVQQYNLLSRTIYHTEFHQTVPKNKAAGLVKAWGHIFLNFNQQSRPLLKSLDVREFGAEAASLSLFYRTRAFLESGIHTYDIAHCHYGPNGNLAALLKRIGAIRGKVITVFHGYDITQLIEQEGPDLYKSLFEVGDFFMPISDRWKEKMVELGCNPDKIIVHRMGVDTNKFDFVPRSPDPDGQVRLLTTARLVEKKGIEYGIRAVAQALQKYPGIIYQIAGDGPLRSDLQKLIDDLNLQTQVKLLGWQPQTEIIRLMREAHIVLAPSVTSAKGDQEGVPTVLMEALAQGLPVLSTCHSGIPELVQDGRSGFLVPERDVPALVEKLSYLIDHPEIWPKLGRAGRDYVEKYFDLGKLNDQLVEFYQQILTTSNLQIHQATTDQFSD